MKRTGNKARTALFALLGGLSAAAGICLDRDKPVRGCLVGLAAGLSLSVISADLLSKGLKKTRLYSRGTRYYEDHQTESGL